MRRSLIILCLLFFQGIVYSQTSISPFSGWIDNYMAFIEGKFDHALVKSNKVATAQFGKSKFYFDTSGRVQKAVLYDPMGKPSREFWNEYNTHGDLLLQTGFDYGADKSFQYTFHKIYERGKLVKDSSYPAGASVNYAYDAKGNLVRISLGHAQYGNRRVILYGVDDAGRVSRVIDRQYTGAMDTVGQLLSDRRVFYNDKGKVAREEESVVHEQSNIPGQITLGGDITYKYNDMGNLVEFARKKGISQKITYNSKGLIEAIETKGDVNGNPFVWQWKYSYTYRD